ncbi:transcription antiterminator [Staphylococcus aureus]|uniref:Transcription antiterminator n=1 Tax=Staphylococcus aureus TaxID=1280 RepID=A0A380EHD1_STAAU|nr:transcription antiterminator [Staphylococcus aureus]
MGEYIVTKTLNNNVVVCTNNDQEVILIGKGIGFNKKEGMALTTKLLQ